MARVSQWSDELGCEGMLIYTDNRLADPWLVSQIVLENTKSLCPLVAIQPIYMHPFTAAKMVASLAYMFGRRVYLNMLAGGFKNDLKALCDETPHDDRYVRTKEYTLIIQELLRGKPVTFEGKYYRVAGLNISPPMPPELYPGVLISGSSEAGWATAMAIGATAVKYPQPSAEETGVEADCPIDVGIRVGVIAREDSGSAWRVAHERFPDDREGELAHMLAMKVSDSSWHKQLSEMKVESTAEVNPYWMHPFKTHRTFCPYLVGSYATVGHELQQYVDRGYRTIILDIPPSREELEHTGKALSYCRIR